MYHQQTQAFQTLRANPENISKTWETGLKLSQLWELLPRPA